jgi:hypothetical protein
VQSDKKFRRDPRPKMLAKDFAIPYAANVEGVEKALANAVRYETVSREAANRQSDKLDKKNSINVANFWNTVQGELKKYQKSLKEGRK